jgi:hypothetical protein
MWLYGLGACLAIFGAVAAIRVLGSTESTGFWRIARLLGAVLGWFVPGVLYLLFGYLIPRRIRWAITGADVISYVQLLLAGILAVISLLNVKALWPILIISLIWVIPLVLTPKIMAPCPSAITMLVQLPTLHLQERPRKSA